MQMQKFELETAAALKAKQMQDGGVEFLVESASAPSVHSPASPMAHDQQFDMVELDPSDFGEGSEFVQNMPMPVNNEEHEIMSYVDLEGAEAIEQQTFQLENNENVKVVVVENNTSQPFYF